ncbi:hypothetical protein L873DRAFT_1807169, partial [Choiromyces venosus 120613-1]
MTHTETQTRTDNQTMHHIIDSLNTRPTAVRKDLVQLFQKVYEGFKRHDEGFKGHYY